MVSISNDGERVLILIYLKNEILHFEDIILQRTHSSPKHKNIISELEDCSIILYTEEIGGRIKFKHNEKAYRYFWKED